MAKNEELTKHTLNLYSGDYATLQDLYPDIGAGPVIRRIVRKFIEQANTSSTENPTTPIKL